MVEWGGVTRDVRDLYAIEDSDLTRRPLTKMAVLGSSISFGSPASIARFEREFFGF